MYLEAEKQMKMFKSCLTTQEIFSQQKNACQGLTYRRIPIPDFCAPKEQVPCGRDGAAASFPKPSLLLRGECHLGARCHPALGLRWCAQARCGMLAGAGRIPQEMLH